MTTYQVPEGGRLLNLKISWASEVPPDQLRAYTLLNGGLWLDKPALPGDRLSLLVVNQLTFPDAIRQ